MKLVILESPFAAPDEVGIQRNIKFARACVKDSLDRGEAPMASHLLFTQRGILDDTIPEERRLGIEAGLSWGRVAEATIVYVNYGVSPGMKQGIDRARAEGRPVELRVLMHGEFVMDSQEGLDEMLKAVSL